MAQAHRANNAEQDAIANALSQRRLGAVELDSKRFFERNNNLIRRTDRLKKRSNVHRHRLRTKARHIDNRLQIAIAIQNADSARLARIDTDDVPQF